MEILRASEDYLESMLMMKLKHGYIRSIDVAEHLGVTKPSVTYATRRLKESGHITMDKDGLITLTAFDEGQGSSLAFTEEILSLQREDGGVSLGDTLQADVDLTAAAVIALVPYLEIPGVSQGVNRALSWLRLQQGADGAFSSAMSEKNAESTAQALTAFALSGQEMSPEAERAAEALLSFQNADGGFAHLPGGESDSRATEQALIALAAYQGGENPFHFSIPAAGKSSDTTLWYWIGGAAVLLALLALGGIIFWRKKHETKPDSSH